MYDSPLSYMVIVAVMLFASFTVTTWGRKTMPELTKGFSALIRVRTGGWRTVGVSGVGVGGTAVGPTGYQG